MDTVILAAGKGERLNGIVARYHKPLVLVNGQPLVRQAARIAHDICGGRIVVVVAPQNAAVISEVLEGVPDTYLIVQQRPTGPGDGLLTGLELVRTDAAMLLMSDNIITYQDVQDVWAARPYGVGVRKLPANEDVERFTRWIDQDTWVEKEPLSERDGDPVLAWVGPVKFNAAMARESLPCMYKAFHDEEKHLERPIGPYLGYIAPQAKLVEVSSVDIGTPEAVTDR
jgi:choline kinase